MRASPYFKKKRKPKNCERSTRWLSKYILPNQKNSVLSYKHLFRLFENFEKKKTFFKILLTLPEWAPSDYLTNWNINRILFLTSIDNFVDFGWNWIQLESCIMSKSNIVLFLPLHNASPEKSIVFKSDKLMHQFIFYKYKPFH